MIYLVVALIIGAANCVNRMVNVKAGQVFGTANGALINYLEATVLALALVFITGRGAELSPEHLASVPLWVYLGGVAGLLAMVLIITGTPRTDVFISTILTLAGNLGMSLVLDYLFYEMFSWKRVAGVCLVLTGAAWIEWQKAEHAKKQPEKAE